tara:strand:- start:1177 stop:2082 length:906 start_codon:yes stop_codon:yes gene_type:complete
MLESLGKATSLDPSEVEILCSWNGGASAENQIINNSGYEFLIAQKDPYHFATNINNLAEKASGDIFLIINDDIILDHNSIDQGIETLNNQSNIGLIGANLRNENNQTVHCGMLFDCRNSPYHKLESLIQSKEENRYELNEYMPAVTGALLLIKRSTFLKIKFNEKYKVCGEDVELCLDIRDKLNLRVVYCPQFSGIHTVSTTRKEKGQYGNNSEDIVLMRQRRKNFISNAKQDNLIDEINAYSKESEELNKLIKSLLNDHEDASLEVKKEIDYWKNQAHSLHLTRIQQSEEIKELKKSLLS